MPQMTDVMPAMESFQAELLLLGEEKPERGVLDRELYVHMDRPKGGFRATYVRLEGRTITAYIEFAPCDPIDGKPCFNIGYAVPEAYRNQGRAKEIVRAAIAEMQHDSVQYGQPVFYVEAIVGADNKASRRVAEQTISDKPKKIKDGISGKPAFQYVRKIEATLKGS
jgi:RimJ/RimL family protein N-acetyltransferase